MSTLTGKTQTYARCINNRMVMKELRAENCSATMLSQRLNLSNAALSAIIGDLKKMGYIKEIEAASKSVGRRPVYYSVNEKFGCIAVVSLTDYYARVVISNMKAQITDSVETRVEKYDVATLYELILTIKNLLSKPECRDIPFLGIELSVPGRVNTVTGELQLSPHFDKELFGEKNYIINLFVKQFNVPVVMTNDLNLAGLGELHSGKLKDVENGMLVHIDEGIGGAFILGRKLYTGNQGFAGEIGLMRTEFEGKFDVLDEFVSLRAIKKKFSNESGKNLHTEDLVKIYGENVDVREYINKTARCLGKLLKDIVELMDISTIVLSGRVCKFGAEYLSILNEEVSKSINNASVAASELGRDASIMGAVCKSVENLTDNEFSEK